MSSAADLTANNSTASSATLASTREAMRKFLEEFGPPRCCVIMPSGEFFSGTIEEMRALLARRVLKLGMDAICGMAKEAPIAEREAGRG